MNYPFSNICDNCGCVIYEELYNGTISPRLCACEPVRIWNNGVIESTHFRSVSPMQDGTALPSLWNGFTLADIKAEMDKA